MKAVIFLGPTLPVDDARTVLDAIYLPPVEQAGLMSAITTYRPDVVGIIDGMFMQSLSVWHKEILFAIQQGVWVYGASSMGALRALETADFGMIGIGEVYRMYACGEIGDDDEVAIAHGPAETGYAGASDAMVNVRVTLRRAVQQGVIDADCHDKLIAIAKAMYFPLRTFPSILERALSEGMPPSAIDRVSAFVAGSYCDVKRDDAILLLETIRDLPANTPPPTPDFQLVRSIFVRTLYDRDRTVRRNDVDVPLAAIADYAAVHVPDFADLNFDATNRSLVRIFAELLKVTPTDEACAEEAHRFRHRHDLEEDASYEDWLVRNDLNDQEFADLMRETATCRALHRWQRMCRATIGTTRPVLDELRLKNRYEEWAAAATLSESIMQNQFSRFETLENTDYSFEAVIQHHVTNSGSFDGLSVAEWAAEAGFLKVFDLEVELRRSKLVREYLQNVARRLEGLRSEDGAPPRDADSDPSTS